MNQARRLYSFVFSKVGSSVLQLQQKGPIQNSNRKREGRRKKEEGKEMSDTHSRWLLAGGLGYIAKNRRRVLISK